MQIVVLADEKQKLAFGKNATGADIIWINEEKFLLQHKNADVFIDLKFVPTDARKNLLVQLLPKPVTINSVVHTLRETHPSFVRINGWNTFLSSAIIEASCEDETIKEKVASAFTFFDKKMEWLNDVPGFITARVVSMIINEAFMALEEGVSTQEEINTAMKLGTAYPYGPFEWANEIGLENIISLLNKLSAAQPKYIPCKTMIATAKII